MFTFTLSGAFTPSKKEKEGVYRFNPSSSTDTASRRVKLLTSLSLALVACENVEKKRFTLCCTERAMEERASRLHAEQCHDDRLVEMLDDIMYRQKEEAEVVRGVTLNGKPIERDDW